MGSTANIDLSAGLQPVKPQAGSIDLSAGLQPAQQQQPTMPPVSAPVRQAIEHPASLWERTKGLAKQFMENATTEDPNNPDMGGEAMGRGAIKEAYKTVGGLLNIFRHMSDVSSPKDVEAYMQEHKGASIEDAMNAVAGKPNLQSTITGQAPVPYRHPDNRKAQEDLKAATKWFADHGNTQGFWEGLGGFGENIAELLTPAGLEKLGLVEAAEGGKALSYADRLKQSQALASFLENNPKIAKLMGLGLRTAHAAARTGAEAGTQTFVKTGGDATEAAKAAAMGAAATGVINPAVEAAGAGVRKVVQHLSPTVENIGGVDVTRLASQNPHASPAQMIAATAEKTQPILEHQQTAGNQVIENAAKGAAENQLAEVNEGRTVENPADPTEKKFLGTETVPNPNHQPIEGPSYRQQRAELGTTAETIPESVRGERSPARERLDQAPAGTRPESVTGSPTIERNKFDVERNPYRYKPTFEPVNIREQVAKVRSFGDAADQVEDAAKEVYNRLDDLTDGRFSALRDQAKAARQSYYNTGSDKARERMLKAEAQINGFLTGDTLGGAVSNTDLAYANQAYRNAQVLRRIHSAVEETFDTDIGTSQRSQAYRGFNGNRLRANLKGLVDEFGQGAITRVIGRGNWNNLTRIAEITRTQADRARFGGSVNHVAQWMARNEGKAASAAAVAGGAIGHFTGAGATTGAITGEALYQATRKVMRAIATDPKIGQQITSAIESGARPENYAPLIAAMVQRNETENSTQEGNEQ